jgi:hypothetical protein
MPIATGYTPVPVQTLPIVIPPVDSIAAVKIIMPSITLGGQILNSPVTDVNGIAWVVQELDGWDSPDVRTTTTPRELDQGLFHEENFYGGRMLIAKGFFASTSGAANLMAAREQLHAACNITGTALVPLVVNENPPKVCMVQRASGCKDKANGPVAFDFEVHLMAPDPRKYAATPTTVNIPANTIQPTTNIGSMESRPVLTITGPASTLVALENVTTSQTVTFNITLAPTDVFVVDFSTKIATYNGLPATFTISSAPSQWWTLVPGLNNIAFATVGSGGNCALVFQSAWI